MTTRTVDVSSDVWTAEGRNPEAGDFLKVRSGEQIAFLWAKNPWPRNAEGLSVSSQILRLTVKGGSSGARELTVRACAKSWVDDEVKWGNKPGGTGPTCTEDVDVLDDLDTVDIDITAIGVAAAAEGGKNYGLRLTTDAAATIRFYSADSQYPPQVITTWTTQPDPPTLNPAGGVISKTDPVVDFGFTNTEGDLTAVRLQVDAGADEASPDFDSTAVLTEVAKLELADTAFPGIADGGTTQWRGTITIGGVESDWSPWYEVTRRSHGTLVVDSPSLGVVTSPTPTVLATFTGNAAAGEVLTSWRVAVYDIDRKTLRYDSGVQPADDPATITAPIPAKWKGKRVLRRKAGAGYALLVQAWGLPDRVDAPDDPAHLETWEDFTVDDAGTPAPTSLAATVEDGAPTALLEFTVTPDAPAQLVLSVDDDLHVLDDAEDYNTGGTSYAVEWAGITPQRPVEIKVAGVDADGQMSAWSNTVTVTTNPRATWFVDLTRGLRVQLWDVDVEQWTFTDVGAYYAPDGSPYSVRVVNSQHGLEGDFVGTIRDHPNLSIDDQVAALRAMKARPNRAVQLITGRWSMEVQLDNVGNGPSNQHRSGLPRELAGAHVRQVDFDPKG